MFLALCSKSLHVTDLGIQKKKKMRVFRLTDCDFAQSYSLRTAAKQTQDKKR